MMDKPQTNCFKIIVWIVACVTLGLLLLSVLLQRENQQLQTIRMKRDIHSSPIHISSDQDPCGNDGLTMRLKRLEAEVALLRAEVNIILTCFGALLSVCLLCLRYYGILRCVFLTIRNLCTTPRTANQSEVGHELQHRLNPDDVD